MISCCLLVGSFLKTWALCRIQTHSELNTAGQNYCTSIKKDQNANTRLCFFEDGQLGQTPKLYHCTNVQSFIAEKVLCHWHEIIFQTAAYRPPLVGLKGIAVSSQTEMKSWARFFSLLLKFNSKNLHGTPINIVW